MARKGLNISQALQIFSELPSDNDSEDTDSSDTEEYRMSDRMSDISDIEINEDDDPDQAGPSTSHVATWTKKRKIERSVIPDFSARSGPSDEMLEISDLTPVAIFHSLISVALMEEIVFQTNLYATQSGKPFHPLALPELYIFFGLNLLMGIKRMPSYRDYWSVEEAFRDTFISSQMSLRRFSWILGHLHLNDNSLQPKKDDKNFDKLYKVRPFLSHLSERFISVLLPSKSQAIDESMIKFKGRSSLKQYMPKKPIKRGYKVWMRCNDSGFASQFEIYTGKTDEIQKHLGEKVVKRLTECLYGKNHQIFMDNYFTTYELFRFLETKQIFSCGTVMLNRKNMPKILAADKELKRGEYDWAVSEDGIICVKWKDKRCVSILSTLPDAAKKIQIERKEKDGTKIKINCPQAISSYNKNMGFVDHFDHLKSLYEIDRKSKKWWHRIFFHFLDVAVINAYILHKMLTNNEIEHAKKFRLELITALCAMGKSDVLSKKRISTSPKESSSYKIRVSEARRLSNVQHIPKKCKSRRCAYCSTTNKPHRTRFMCETCGVGLCFFQKGATCFQKFHAKEP